MAKPTVDYNKVMQAAFKKYGVDMQKITSKDKAVRDAEMLKMAKGWGTDWKTANLCNWGKENGASFFPQGVNDAMKAAGFTNTQVSPKPVNTTPANGGNTKQQFLDMLEGKKPSETHTISHSEYLFIGIAKETLLSVGKLEDAYAEVNKIIREETISQLEELKKRIEQEALARAEAEMTALTGNKPDREFFLDIKLYVGGDEYTQDGWYSLKPADKNRLIDMGEKYPQWTDLQKLIASLDKDAKVKTEATNPIEPDDEFKIRMYDAIKANPPTITADEEKRLEAMAKSGMAEAKEILDVLYKGREAAAEKAAEAEAKEQPTDGAVSPSETSAA
ncbi:hypothetical protein ACLAI9_07840 [Klebsiella pneumoniae]|uniref:hypothetical protein n=1 Tax=Klebsiella pneumoniae TaxID=573 RepID=UPI000E2E0510|nr:hypothetical protein [Klebsiella pneumoniae]HDS3562484.1 hypothetical protein [Klebsiella pneumoniae subsp. pneumoniae]MBC5024414.1 hypothetical protein [Klebsiella pneumoniae]MBC5214536.1 hypothetical protein [Klebsiella pneumoniae]MBD1046520.1 hypothetical protein [Klebsiella pneumoniae]MBD1056614.1 hypothetical protein [Klebsiella pneumoniae]